MIPKGTARLVLAAALALAVAGSLARAAEPFGATSDRRFDDVERWSQVFDDPGRDEWQKPAAVVAALGLAPGATVADLGAGTGYFSRHLAGAVGPSGTVFAVEVEPNLVVHLRERAVKEGLVNVVPVLGSPDNPRLPSGGVDLVMIVDTFHHIDGRLAYFGALKRVLRERGRVVVIDWKKKELPVGPEMSHKIDRDEVVGEMAAAGYRLVSESDLLPYQYFLTFAP